MRETLSQTSRIGTCRTEPGELLEQMLVEKAQKKDAWSFAA